MARYKVTLAYDGTEFFGFQRQAKARTVQGAVEAALHRLNWQGRSILSAGRTDTGVHAAGQTIAFDLEWAHSPVALQNAINAYLPEDVAAQDVTEVADHFHPRYDAYARLYQYRVIVAAERQPLAERYAWRVWPAPDWDRMEAAASLLPGTHDFAAFGAPPKAGGSTVRSIQVAEWRHTPNSGVFDIQGNAFLYRMVRRLTAYLMAIGRGELPVEALAAQLNRPGDTSPQGTAPAHGLTLAAVIYPETGEGTKRANQL